MKVGFLCQPDWAEGCFKAGKTRLLRVSVKVSVEEISI